jgi:hypothetical protein
MLLLTASLAANQISGITPAQCARNAEKQRADFANKIANVIIFRINYPKVLAAKDPKKRGIKSVTQSHAGSGGFERTISIFRAPTRDSARPLLSFHDCEEARQSCALTLIACGAMDRGFMTLSDWKVAFREVRGVLNIDRNAKRGQSDTANPIDLMSEAEADFLTASARKPYHTARRIAIARKINYLRAQVFAAFTADSKRSRKATFKKQLAVSRFLASQFSTNSQGFAEILEKAEAESALRVTILRFRKYCELGEIALTASALDGIKARKIEFKSFADLFAVCD